MSLEEVPKESHESTASSFADNGPYWNCASREVLTIVQPGYLFTLGQLLHDTIDFSGVKSVRQSLKQVVSWDSVHCVGSVAELSL